MIVVVYPTHPPKPTPSKNNFIKAQYCPFYNKISAIFPQKHEAHNF